jgi:protein Mpv17
MVKSAAGQLTLFPTYTCAFFMYMGSLEGRSLTGSWDKLVHAFPAAATTGTLFWPVANLITFQLAPSQRVAFLGIAGVAWNAVLSYLNARGEQRLVL